MKRARESLGVANIATQNVGDYGFLLWIFQNNFFIIL